MVDQKLLTLIAVEKYKNFSKAAEKLALTQPAVSIHIKLLEKEFGTKIFNKREKQLMLTTGGAILLDFAKRMVSLDDLAHEQIENDKHNLKSITIGMSHSAENSEVTKVLASYTEQKVKDNKKINIKIFSDSIKNIYKKLKTYEIDFAIIDGVLSGKDFNTVLLDTDTLVLIVSKDNPLSQKNIITLNDLKNERLILRHKNSDSRKRFEASLQNSNMNIRDFNVTLELDSISVIKNLVSENYGVSIVPKSSCMDNIKNSRFKIINVENLSIVREINIVYQKDFTHIDEINDIIELYQQLNFEK